MRSFRIIKYLKPHKDMFYVDLLLCKFGLSQSLNSIDNAQ